MNSDMVKPEKFGHLLIGSYEMQQKLSGCYTKQKKCQTLRNVSMNHNHLIAIKIFMSIN